MWHVTHCYTFWATISTQKWDQCFRHYLHIWYHRRYIMKLKLLGFLPFFIKNEWKNISSQNDAYLHEKIACLVYKSIHTYTYLQHKNSGWSITSLNIKRQTTYMYIVYFNLHTAAFEKKPHGKVCFVTWFVSSG